MKRILLVCVLAGIGCASTKDIVDSAQGVVEYHSARYKRVCADGMDASVPCVSYGIAINNLVDVLGDVENGTDTSLMGKLPKDSKQALEDAKKAVSVTANRIKAW